MPASARSTTSSVKRKSRLKPGYSASRRGTSGTSSMWPVELLAVMRTVPRGSAAVATERSSSSRSASTRWPCSYRRQPSGLSCTFRVLRCKSCTPRRVSSRVISLLTAEGDTPSWRAAADRLPRSATCTSACSSLRRSVPRGIRGDMVICANGEQLVCHCAHYTRAARVGTARPLVFPNTGIRRTTRTNHAAFPAGAGGRCLWHRHHRIHHHGPAHAGRGRSGHQHPDRRHAHLALRGGRGGGRAAADHRHAPLAAQAAADGADAHLHRRQRRRRAGAWLRLATAG